MKRREFIKTAGGMILLAGAPPWTQVLAETSAAGRGGPPMNILFITADDMNATMPGWMGNPLKLTPNMDAFAATCHRFTANRDAAPICMPSREAMMTGLLPHHSGGQGFVPINEGIPTMVTVLQANGYFAGAIDKLIHMMPGTCFPWDHKVDGCGKNPVKIGEAMDEALAAAKASGKPFFINCNITDPHRPFYESENPPRKNDAVGVLARVLGPDDVTVPSFLEDLPDIRKEYAQYCNSVQRLDLSFGKILASLQASGAMDHTIVLFVSDHGMPFPFSKATVYNNGPWCPVLLHYPGMGKPQVREEMTGSIDLMPTLLELLKIPNPPAMDGRSWLPLLKGETQPDRDFATCQVHGLSSGLYYTQRLVQTKSGALIYVPWASSGTIDFKCESMKGLTYAALAQAGRTDPRIQSRVDQYIKGFPLAFYDLVKDPDQRVNAINDPRYHEEIARLKQLLLSHMEKHADPELENYKTLLAGGTIHYGPPGPGKREAAQSKGT